MSIDLNFDDFFGGGDADETKHESPENKKFVEDQKSCQKKVMTNNHFDHANGKHFLSTIKEENESSYCSSYYPGDSKVKSKGRSKDNKMIEEFSADELDELVAGVENNLQ